MGLLKPRRLAGQVDCGASIARCRFCAASSTWPSPCPARRAVRLRPGLPRAAPQRPEGRRLRARPRLDQLPQDVPLQRLRRDAASCVQGRNALGVMLGNGMYNVAGGRYVKFHGSFGPPKLILQLHVEYADGTSSVVASDGAWRTAAGPDHLLLHLRRRGLRRPAGDRPAGTGRDSTTRVGGAGSSRAPAARLVAQSAPPIKVMQEFKPVKVTQPKPGVFVYDLGQNFSGWPQLTVARPRRQHGEADPRRAAGRRRPGDASAAPAARCGSPTRSRATGSESLASAVLLLRLPLRASGRGRPGRGEPMPLPSSPQRASILTGQFVHCSAETVGRFRVLQSPGQSHPRADRRGHSQQPPERADRLPAPREARLAGGARTCWPAASCSTTTCPPCTPRSATTCARRNLPNGLVPDIAPEYAVFPRRLPRFARVGQRLRARSLARLPDVRRPRRWSGTLRGDEAVRRSTWGASRTDTSSRTAWATGTTSGPGPPGESQLTSTRPDRHGHLLCRTSRSCQRRPSCWARRTTPSDTPSWPARSAAAFNKQVLPSPTRTSTTATAKPPTPCRWCWDWSSEDRRAAVLENLVGAIRGRRQPRHRRRRGLHVPGARPDRRRPRRRALRHGLPGRRARATLTSSSKGATTLTEAWDCQPALLAEPLHVGPRRGMVLSRPGRHSTRSGRPGLQEVHHPPRPACPSRLGQAQYDSIHGRIATRWKREAGAIHLDLTVPANTTATLFLPAGSANAVTESGQPAAKAPGVKFARMAAGLRRV